MDRRVAVVTGASRGIGRRLCVDLAAAGFDVVCAARTARGGRGRLAGGVEETAAEVAECGRRTIAAVLDVRDEPAVEALAARVAREWGRCDLLINNAAVAPPGPALDDSTRRWRLAVDVNLNGPFYLIYHFRRLLEACGGRVVNISSGAAVSPEFGRASYTATKRALEGLTECLARDLRERVAVNCIRLEVPVWTEGFEATLPDGADRSVFEDPVIMSDAVLWLAGRELAYTGEILSIAELRRLGAVRPQTRISC